jgi:hypothetical protein
MAALRGDISFRYLKQFFLVFYGSVDDYKCLFCCTYENHGSYIND